MKPDNSVRFTIIGLGNLMEVIWHCIEGALGGGDLDQRAVATTADAPDIHRKQAVFGIPVQLHGNLDALRRTRPDIVFFAPPPTVAPTLIESDLRPYVEECRSQGRDLPDIYAFPPLPGGQHYRDVLGPDINVVNLIPNNVSRIAGKSVTDEGYYVCSFPAPWPRDANQRLRRIFKNQGAHVEVPPRALVPMLGGTCTIFSLWRVVPAVTDILIRRGYPVHHNRVGAFLRARVQATTGYCPHLSTPAAGSTLDGFPAVFLTAVADGWYDGVGRFYRDIGFPSEAARIILTRGFDLILHTTQAETRAALNRHAVGAATKGGVLEKAVATFHETIEPMMAAGAEGTLAEPWSKVLGAAVCRMAHSVKEHGLTLAG
jgi:hypothetical protein